MKRLSKAQEYILLEKVKRGDSGAFETLKVQYTPLLARSCAKYGLEKEDAEQEMDITLWQAAQKFEPERNLRFITYLTNGIKFRALGVKRKIPPESVELPQNVEVGSVTFTEASDFELMLPWMSFMETFCVKMVSEGWSKAALAKKLQCSVKRVNRILEEAGKKLEGFIK